MFVTKKVANATISCRSDVRRRKKPLGIDDWAGHFSTTRSGAPLVLFCV